MVMILGSGFAKFLDAMLIYLSCNERKAPLQNGNSRKGKIEWVRDQQKLNDKEAARKIDANLWTRCASLVYESPNPRQKRIFYLRQVKE